jgi:hypothetical protein
LIGYILYSGPGLRTGWAGIDPPATR